MSRIQNLRIIHANLREQMITLHDAFENFCQMKDPNNTSFELGCLRFQIQAIKRSVMGIEIHTPNIPSERRILAARIILLDLYEEVKRARKLLKCFRAKIEGKWHIIHIRLVPRPRLLGIL